MVTKPDRVSLSRSGKYGPGTETRRAWLLALTSDQLRAIIRAHTETVESPFASCWGWGATATGLDEGDPVPSCAKCNRATKYPLWFTNGEEVWARCWKCAAIDHLTDCDLWSLP